MKKLAMALSVAGLLAGCSSFPEHYEKPVTITDVRAETNDTWSATPAMTFVHSNTGKILRKYAEIPADSASTPVKLSFNKLEAVTIGDVLYALRAKGLRVIHRLSDESLAETWMTPEFNGTVGELIQDISDTHNLGYEYRRGAIYLTEANQYSASMPQHDEFLQQVEKALASKGATDVQTDVQAGQIHFSAKPDAYDGIRDYLESVTKNSAMVSLQVAVLTVGMNRDVSLGLDWSALGAKTAQGGYRSDLSIGNSAANAVVGAASSSAGSVGVGAGGETTAAPAEAAAHTMGRMLSFVGGSGVGLQLGTNAFSLSAAFKALSTYGNARTEQNVVVGTLSGLPVLISSGNDIPYVKDIGSTTASGGSVNGSSTTEIIQSGLSVEVTPRFDASDSTVVTEVKVDLSSLVGFRELSAGVNLGTLSQPEMQKLKFEGFNRIIAGETMVVGGVSYDQLNNSYNNAPGMENMNTGSKSEKVQRNAMYILVRPTVTMFTPYAAELNAAFKAKEEQMTKPSKTMAQGGGVAPKVQPEQRRSKTMVTPQPQVEEHQQRRSKTMVTPQPQVEEHQARQAKTAVTAKSQAATQEHGQAKPPVTSVQPAKRAVVNEGAK